MGEMCIETRTAPTRDDLDASARVRRRRRAAIDVAIDRHRETVVMIS
jgi:hypothetical protein